MEDYTGRDELHDRLQVIAVAVDRFVGVGQIEHLLVDLLDLLESDRVERSEAAAALISLIEPWPGAPEILEFTMRRLQWPEVREALQAQVESDSDFRTRDLARQALQVYEADWPAGEIYRTYREG